MPDPTVADSFFTNQSFFSLAGATAIVFVVSNAVQRAFNFNPRWFALVIAEAVAIFGTYASGGTHVATDYFIAVLNGCLIYTTACGTTTIAAGAAEAGTTRGQEAVQPITSKRKFLSSWF